jgi:hypothetical protein
MKPLLPAIATLSVILLICWACDVTSSLDFAQGDVATTLAALADDEWLLYDEVQHFTPENLYEHINGRAELYLSYNVHRLTYASFDNRNDDQRSIGVSVYDMGSPLNAFGIYSVERLEEEEKIDLGRDAYRTNADYYIWHGQHYIRIISVDAGDESRHVGLDWARTLVESLPEDDRAVWGFETLPRENLIQDSVRYFLVDAMGLDFLRDTFVARYGSEAGPVTAFISRSASPNNAPGILNQYREFADRYGDGTETQTRDETEFLVCDMGDSFDVVTTKGNLFLGVTAVNDRNQALRLAADLWNSLPESPRSERATDGTVLNPPPAGAQLQ